MTVKQQAVPKCEPVLFMLMPGDRCEDNHVDGRVTLTILRLPHYPDVGGSRCTPQGEGAPKMSIETRLVEQRRGR